MNIISASSPRCLLVSAAKILSSGVARAPPPAAFEFDLAVAVALAVNVDLAVAIPSAPFPIPVSTLILPLPFSTLLDDPDFVLQDGHYDPPRKVSRNTKGANRKGSRLMEPQTQTAQTGWPAPLF